MTLISEPPPAPDPYPDPESEPGPAHPEDELRAFGDALLDAQRQVHAAAAERLRALDALRLRWEDHFGGSMTADRNGLRFRSFRAEVAALLAIAERTAETLLWQAMTLVHQLPATLDRLSEGRISERHVRLLADAVADLDREDAALLERRSLPYAEALNPGKFGAKLRTLKALLHPEELTHRHRTAIEQRDLELEPVEDGMAWLHLHLAAEDAVAGYNFAQQTALRLHAVPGETRTVAQLRSDILRDLLLDGAGLLPPREGETELREQVARPRGIVPSVHVTAPALSLAGAEDEPAELAAYGPIDPRTARRLAGAASGFYRILTDPGTGAVLQFGKEKYAVPPELRRFLIERDGTCREVGCNRDARTCDVDHTKPWASGHSGCTDHDNLAHLCPNHHAVKHDGLWKVEQDRDEPGVLIWTTPMGYRFTTEPKLKLKPSRPPKRKAGNVRAQTEWADNERPPF